MSSPKRTRSNSRLNIKKKVNVQDLVLDKAAVDYNSNPIKPKTLAERKEVSESLEISMRRKKEENFEKKEIKKRRKKTGLKNETRKKKFACTDCSATFSRLWNLERHLREYHEGQGERPFKCSVDLCPASFKQKATLKAHVETVHGNAKRLRLEL